MKALHFGAGNIGRGFIGKLLADSGIHVIFADVNQAVIDEINKSKSYMVRVVDQGADLREEVKNISAISSADISQTTAAIVEVDLLTTAVGPNILKLIAPAIAQGIIERLKNNTQPLNIIACENMVKATEFLKTEVLFHIPQNLHHEVQEKIGFINSAVDRIVPQVAADPENPLLVTVEKFSEWIVDQNQFIGKIPEIKGMQLTDNLLAFVERKLFTLNTGHATTAYLGKLKNIKLVKDAIKDVAIRESVKNTMMESGEVLIKRFDFDRQTHMQYIEKILSRFANPYLDDDVDRVGRQPIRKLSPNERLIKPLLGTIEYQIEHQYLIKAIAAALLYQNDDDPQAQELMEYIDQQGIEQAIRHYTQLDNETILAEIINSYEEMKS